MVTTVNCPTCGKLTDPRLDNCPHCGVALKPQQPKRERTERKRSQTCPNCGAMVQEGDIICVACGTNLLTGQKLAGKPESKVKESSSLPWLIAVGVASVVLIIAGVFWVYLSTRNPVQQAIELREAGETLEAVNILREYVREEPEDELALFELGRLHYDLGDFAPAADAFERAVRINPSNQDAALWAIVALTAANPANPPVDRQIALLQRASDADPNNASLLYLLALAKGASGDIGGQIDTLEAVVRIQPAEPLPRLALGSGLALQGQYQAAQSQLARISQEEAQPKKNAVLGFLYAIGGNESDARDRLLQAMAAPDLPVRQQALTLLGKLLIEEGNYSQAESFLDDAIRLNRNDSLARFLHALSLHSQGRTDDALTEYEALMQERRQFAQEAAVQAAKIYLSNQEPNTASDALSRARSLGAAGPEFQTISGRIQAARGDLEAARAAFNSALASDPDYAPAHLELGLVFVRQQAFERGLLHLRRYLELVGDSSRDVPAFQIRELINQLVRASDEAGETQRRGSAPRTGDPSA